MSKDVVNCDQCGGSGLRSHPDDPASDCFKCVGIGELVARNPDLDGMMRACFDLGIEEGARAITARRLANDPNGLTDLGRIRSLSEVVSVRALNQGGDSNE